VTPSPEDGRKFSRQDVRRGWVKRKRPVLNSGIGVIRKNRMYGTAELSTEPRRNATRQAASIASALRLTRSGSTDALSTLE